jgi:SAM-dependent methyltransferase
MARQAENFFDAMADGYEVLEPWYEHLYATLHAVLRSELTPPADMPRARALDAGCGTGFQAAILDEMGYAVHGLDLSRELLRGARERLLRAPLVQGDVQTLPYRDGGFDAATLQQHAELCGDAWEALAEIARVQARVGCSSRRGTVQPGPAWAWLSGFRRSAGYVTPAEWRRDDAARPGVRLGIPGKHTPALQRGTARLLRAGTRGRSRLGFTDRNLLPSTVLHRAAGRRVAAVYRALRGADRALAARWPAARLANSLVVLARKGPPNNLRDATPGSES